jgi:hypothetical protein
MKLKTLVNRRGCKPNQEYLLLLLLLLLGLPLISVCFSIPHPALVLILCSLCQYEKERVGSFLYC